MNVVKFENIKDLIIELREQKVIIDQDAAHVYGVETKRINEAVKNNSDKFPEDYFQKQEQLPVYLLKKACIC